MARGSVREGSCLIVSDRAEAEEDGGYAPLLACSSVPQASCLRDPTHFLHASSPFPPPGCSGVVSSVYLTVTLFSTHTDPRAIFVATPPAFRGGLTSPRDLELQLNAHFPEIPIFLEKPVATGAPWQESVGEAKEVAKRLEAGHKGVISIG